MFRKENLRSNPRHRLQLRTDFLSFLVIRMRYLHGRKYLSDDDPERVLRKEHACADSNFPIIATIPELQSASNAYLRPKPNTTRAGSLEEKSSFPSDEKYLSGLNSIGSGYTSGS